MLEVGWHACRVENPLLLTPRNVKLAAMLMYSWRRRAER